MTKGIFTTKPDSGYDDIREERYHFPKQYLARVQRIVGDQVIYYEPRRGNGRSSYIAVAVVDSVDPDPHRDGFFYARMSQFFSFEIPVPFRLNGLLFEHGLQSDGATGLGGDFRNAVRTVSEGEFNAILAAGFSQFDEAPEPEAVDGLVDPPSEFRRPIIEQITRKPFREAAFARQVKVAYKSQCAFTGLGMRNGGGRSEVDAAHIKPVGDGHNGSDSIRNGLALSKTVHWMFDRGLLSVDSDHKILLAGELVPEPIKRLLHPSGYLLLPEKPLDRPHPAFLDYHRNYIFKGAKSGG